MKLLLVEDEQELSVILKKHLVKNGYSVDVVYDGTSGEEAALGGIYDGIILDIMLPGKSGLEVLATLRGQGVQTPVLLLTAKSEVQDKITGLDLGADDYLAKPFATGELLARLRAITRRKGELGGNTVSVGGLSLHLDTHALSHDGETIRLGAKEFLILELFMNNQDRVIPKERIIEKVWGYESEAEYKTIEVYLSMIRKKLAAVSASIRIKAVRGIGYVLEVER